MFGVYNKYILPRLLDKDMRAVEFNETRKNVVEQARGVVLEIGFGSGYNLPFFRNVEKFYALEPSAELYQYAKNRISEVNFPFEYIQSSAESIPLNDNSVDTVVSTWTLCSIPDLSKTLTEVHRVLKPGGKFLFVEHGKSPVRFYSLLQNLLTPITKPFTGNCHLNREIDSYIKESGLIIEKIETFTEEGRPLMYSFKGVARKS